MTKLIDLTGRSFGRLTVTERAENNGKETRWLCRCECGNETIVHSSHLRSGHTKSCGCLVKEVSAAVNLQHGKSYTKLHRILRSVRCRCKNENDPVYKHYGGRGISICKEWETDASAFLDWAESNGYKQGLTLDRIDNDGDYCPENCRFVDRYAQANNKRNNRWHTYRGKQYTLAQLSRMSELNAESIAIRIKRGMSVEDAVEKPSRTRKRRKRNNVHTKATTD